MDLAQLVHDLVAAAKTGDQDETLALLRELDPNKLRLTDVRDQLGSTPLHWAAAKGHKDVAKMLLSNGADASSMNDAGDTPLHWATTLGKPDLVDLLINYNADLYAANKKGMRPIDLEPSNPAIKAKLQAHLARLEEAKANQSAAQDKLHSFMNSPTGLSSPGLGGGFDVLASSSASTSPGIAPVYSVPGETAAAMFRPPSFVFETVGSSPSTEPSTPVRRQAPPSPMQATTNAHDDDDDDDGDDGSDAPPFFAKPPPPPPPPPVEEEQELYDETGYGAEDELPPVPPPKPSSNWQSVDIAPAAAPAPAPAPAAATAPAAASKPAARPAKQAAPPRPALPPVSKITTASSVPRSPVISPPMPTASGKGDDDDDDDGDDDDGKEVKIEFWDAAEEMQYQKMLVHFGKDMAEKALEEIRRVREKRGEVPPWKRAAAAATIATTTPAPAQSAAATKAAQDEAAAIISKVAASEKPSFMVKNQTDEDRAKWEKDRLLHKQAAARTPEELENGFREDALYDYADGVKKAIELGVNVDSKDETGMTAMMLASAGGHKKTLLALFKAKAKRNLKNKQGQTALHIAVATGQSESLRVLIKYKAKVDVKDKEGRTPMMVAAVRGDLAAVQTLVEAGTTIDRPDKTGKTALMLAVFAEEVEVTMYLLQAGAQVDLVDKFGWSALMFGAHAGNVNLVKMLLSQGANADFVNSRGKSAMHLAGEAGQTEIYKMIEAQTAASPATGAIGGNGNTLTRKQRSSIALNNRKSVLDLVPAAAPPAPMITRAEALQKLLDPDVNNWTEDDVGVWLLKLGEEFEPVVAVFRENNISGRRLQRLTDDKLQQLGVGSMGLRDDILDEIANLSTTTRI